MKVQTLTVDAQGTGQRLDRWLKRHYPSLPQSLIERWARKGHLRVEAQKTKPGVRLTEGQKVYIPVFEAIEPAKPTKERRAPKLTAEEKSFLKQALLYQNNDFIVLNKPAGLAVQGGSKTRLHVADLFALWQEDTPQDVRLVHRLDKETSGVLLLARHLRAAQFLAQRFKEREITKIYLAVVVGCLKEKEGIISYPLLKRPGRKGEKMMITEEGQGLPAVTRYRVLQQTGNGVPVALVEFRPLTGRTHQLRAHAAALGAPILGDGKYGGAQAHIDGKRWPLHLHAYAFEFQDLQGQYRQFTAPLPAHMLENFKILGLSLSREILAAR